jgi:hypothetical protein
MYLVSGCSEYGLSIRPPLLLAPAITWVVGKAFAPEISGFGLGTGIAACEPGFGAGVLDGVAMETGAVVAGFAGGGGAKVGIFACALCAIAEET